VNLTWQTIDGFSQRQRLISAAVRERATLNSNLLQVIKQLAQKLLTEPGSDSAGKFQVHAFVKTNEQGAEVLSDPPGSV
jgi:hypothetical protein